MFSQDITATPSTEAASDVWEFLAMPWLSLQPCGAALVSQAANEWLNGRFVAYQHQAPSRQETKG